MWNIIEFDKLEIAKITRKIFRTISKIKADYYNNHGFE